jgi:hypothetical protein
MAELFESITEGGYYQPFGGLTPEQEQCRDFTRKHLDDLLCARQREKYVKEVKVCACGFGPSDEDEPMDVSNFSQLQFFEPYTNDLVFFVDKFDFVALCIAHGVCKIHEGFEDRFKAAVLASMTFKHLFTPVAPEHVLDLRQPTTPRTVGETLPESPPRYREDREESYRTRRRSFANAVRSELAELEAEQFAAEKARGEHPSVMGWEDGDHRVKAAADTEAHAAEAEGVSPEASTSSVAADADAGADAHGDAGDAPRAPSAEAAQDASA